MNRGEYDRFMALVRKRPGPMPDDCWIWIGDTTPNGYGAHRIRPGEPRRAAHRISYEQHVGPIPGNRQLDHLCRDRSCVNPTHLEPVTAAENTDRQDHANRRKTHCPRGHEYTPANTTIRNGRRFCRKCAQGRKRRTSSSNPDA